MINSLAIQNFRSCKNIFVEFDRGINIFIGTSDSGKTNILRAIELVTSNKPSGDSFRSWWLKRKDIKEGKTNADTVCDLNVDDGTRIIRVKGGENIYEVRKGKSIVQYKSFNQGVPEEIKSILNFSSLNLQSQFDSPFLLAMSGGEVARYLNKIVHLDKIDLSLSNIGKTLRKEQTDLKYTEKEYDTAKEKEKEFDWIDEAEGCLVKLETFEGVIRNKKNRYASLHLLCTRLEECDEEIKEVSQLTQYGKEVNKLIDDQEALELRKKSKIVLSDAINNLRQIENAITDIGGAVPKWQEEFDELMPQRCPLCGRGE